MVGPCRGKFDSPWGPRLARALLLGVGLAAGCATLPPMAERASSRQLDGTAGTALGRTTAPLSAAHPGLTGLHVLDGGVDAFAARVALARAAERSLDAQYYIWRDDESGLLLLEELAAAAARGVRVRLLLDDQNTRRLEPLLAALAARPRFEVRLYNPFAHRTSRMLDYLGDFSRVNRRMHNKAFIADGQVAVVGGRNVANEYFHAGSQVPLVDLDLFTVGAAVGPIGAQFDLYWNSASAYPAAQLLGPPPAGADAALAERFAANRADPVTRAYMEAVRATALVADLQARSLPLEWAEARLVHDDPAKTLDTTDKRDVLLLSRLLEGGSRPASSFDIVSPYFAPGERGAEHLAQLARSGVHVRLLTSSLAGSEAAVVHSGYTKRRCELARAGVRLYELKPSVGERPGESKPGESANASLHAKTFAADGRLIFVGSFNFDLRSALLNTEMGLVVRSPELAGRLGAAFGAAIPANAYEVRAPPGGKPCVEWIERTAKGEVRHETEPLAGWAKRAWLGFLELLPIDWLL